MSFRDPASDVSRINRAPPGEAVEVDPRTAEVLRLAIEIQKASAGAFDCTVAPVLVRHHLLPSAEFRGAHIAEPQRFDRPASPMFDRTATFVVDTSSVVKQRDCLIDLGGIAKGYAVDRAIEAITAKFAESGHPIGNVLVNAGGDLRFHGESAIAIRLRDPRDPARLVDTIEIPGGALASSATSGLGGPAGRVSALVDPLSGTPLPPGGGVTIAAPTCAIADALTKVALTTGDPTHPVFARYGASVVRFYPGRPSRSGHR
jgi:thiamine biosynthesis lipoprotein